MISNYQSNNQYLFNIFKTIGALYLFFNGLKSLLQSNNLTKDYNIRLPSFLSERYCSYWFSKLEKKKCLSYARLGKFMLSNNINKFINPTKIPFTFRMYPTFHNY